MKGKLLIVFLVVACSACDDESFLSGREYHHDFYDSYEECLANQPGGFFINCSQVVQFHDDSEVDIMFTDIMYRGTYRVERRKIYITLEHAMESSRHLTFFILQDDKLKLEGPGTIWKFKD